MIKLPIFILMWLMMIAIKLPTALAGLFMTPLLYRYRGDHYDSLPWWTRPWANPEDWEGRGNGLVSLPKWWMESRGTGFKSWYHYHAIRNPSNGLRSFEALDLDIDPDKVMFKRSKNFSGLRYDLPEMRALEGEKTIWYFAWQGYRAGFNIYHLWPDDPFKTPRHLNIKFGWRVEPSDAVATHTNIGIEDASFASKVLLYRKG